MTVLVAYGTTGGSTAEIADWIAEELRAAGLDTRVLAAGAVEDVAGYEALVLGAAMYAGGWHADARQFAKRFAGNSPSGRPGCSAAARSTTPPTTPSCRRTTRPRWRCGCSRHGRT